MSHQSFSLSNSIEANFSISDFQKIFPVISFLAGVDNGVTLGSRVKIDQDSMATISAAYLIERSGPVKSIEANVIGNQTNSLSVMIQFDNGQIAQVPISVLIKIDQQEFGKQNNLDSMVTIDAVNCMINLAYDSSPINHVFQYYTDKQLFETTCLTAVYRCLKSSETLMYSLLNDTNLSKQIYKKLLKMSMRIQVPDFLIPHDILRRTTYLLSKILDNTTNDIGKNMMKRRFSMLSRYSRVSKASKAISNSTMNCSSLTSFFKDDPRDSELVPVRESDSEFFEREMGNFEEEIRNEGNEETRENEQIGQ